MMFTGGINYQRHLYAYPAGCETKYLASYLGKFQSKEEQLRDQSLLGTRRETRYTLSSILKGAWVFPSTG